ncbi:MAG TPA: dienelactone hydrolase family protein [Caulobacterales bacterium]|nr:dienelactone hydrolase family protein [Caulobacterales bacterium]
MPAPSTLGERVAQLAPYLSVSKPRGDGPFTTVLMMPGCGGKRPFLDTWADAITRAGAAAVIVDSHGLRGISRLHALSLVCTGAQMRGSERAGDLYAAMAWAKTQDWIDHKRVLAAGWSHGAWAIMDGLALRAGANMRRATGLTDVPEEPLADLAGAFLMYPYAGIGSLSGRRWRRTLRGVAIVGGRDSIVGTAIPRRALERQRAHGAPLEIHLFPTVTHAFDEPEASHPQVKYDAAETKRAHQLMADFIASFA